MPKAKRKFRLLPHETELLASSALTDVTHAGASSKWLHADSSFPSLAGRVLCYRHMGDREFQHLLQTNQLPDTQPYQTLTREEEGRQYCESYLRSNKTVDTNPTTVVEFDCPFPLIDDFYRIQSKIEEGTISHGLGDKAGKTLPRFNAALVQGDITWRIVLVKRAASSQVKSFVLGLRKNINFTYNTQGLAVFQGAQILLLVQHSILACHWK